MFAPRKTLRERLRESNPAMAAYLDAAEIEDRRGAVVVAPPPNPSMFGAPAISRPVHQQQFQYVNPPVHQQQSQYVNPNDLHGAGYDYINGVVVTSEQNIPLAHNSQRGLGRSSVNPIPTEQERAVLNADRVPVAHGQNLYRATTGPPRAFGVNPQRTPINNNRIPVAYDRDRDNATPRAPQAHGPASRRNVLPNNGLPTVIGDNDEDLYNATPRPTQAQGTDPQRTVHHDNPVPIVIDYNQTLYNATARQPRVHGPVRRSNILPDDRVPTVISDNNEDLYNATPRPSRAQGRLLPTPVSERPKRYVTAADQRLLEHIRADRHALRASVRGAHRVDANGDAVPFPQSNHGPYTPWNADEDTDDEDDWTAQGPAALKRAEREAARVNRAARGEQGRVVYAARVEFVSAAPEEVEAAAAEERRTEEDGEVGRLLGRDQCDVSWT